MVGGSLIADAVAEALPAWLDGQSGGRKRSVARWELPLNDFLQRSALNAYALHAWALGACALHAP